MAQEKLYKTFTPNLLKLLQIKTSKEFYFFANGAKIELQEKNIDGESEEIHCLIDKERNWSKYKNESTLFIDLTITLENTQNIFFGPEKCCDNNSVIGLGVMWKSSNSRIKRCLKIGEISKKTDATITFEKKTLAVDNPGSDIDIKWFFYISKPGAVDTKQHFAPLSGLILAEGLIDKIKNSGNGSLFPLTARSQTNGPLWDIYVNFDDWNEDTFSCENIKIILNTSHPLYPMIDMDSPEYNKLVLDEVLSSAVTALLFQICVSAKEKEQFEQLNGENANNGSILAAMMFFKKEKNFVFDNSIEHLSLSIKKYFDGRKQ